MESLAETMNSTSVDNVYSAESLKTPFNLYTSTSVVNESGFTHITHNIQLLTDNTIFYIL